MKGVRIRGYSGPYFPVFGLSWKKYGVSYSVQMWENIDQHNSEHGRFSGSATKSNY